jgi:spermidine synthase
MITAFWLVPLVGTHAILRTLGLCLAAMALIGLTGSRALLAVTAPVLPLVFALSVWSPSPFVRLEAAQKSLFEADSAYHHVLVVDDDHTDTRLLRFNNFIESVVNRQPPHDSDNYTNSFQLARIFKRDLQRVMVIGGGGAIGPRQFVDQDPQTVVDLVEIDPLVVDISRRYFFLPDDGRLKVHVDDGRNFVRATTDRYDLIILDAFTVGGQVPFHLTTQEFMREIRLLLKPEGVFLVNVNSAVEGPNSRILRAEYKTALTIFDEVLIFPRPFNGERGKPKLALSRGRNVMLVGLVGRHEWTLDSIAAAANLLVQQGKARTPTFLDDAMQLYTGRVRTDDVPLLTDDYAPVDTMVF